MYYKIFGLIFLTVLVECWKGAGTIQIIHHLFGMAALSILIFKMCEFGKAAWENMYYTIYWSILFTVLVECWIGADAIKIIATLFGVAALSIFFIKVYEFGETAINLVEAIRNRRIEKMKVTTISLTHTPSL